MFAPFHHVLLYVTVTMVLLLSHPLQSPEALEGMRQALEAAGVTLDELLAGLADIRPQMLRERYGITPSH